VWHYHAAVTTVGWVLEAIAAAAIVVLIVVRVVVRARRRPRILVRESAGFRELWLSAHGLATLQSRVSRADPLVSGIPYTDGLHLFPPASGEVLFLGGGAAVTPRQFVAFYPGVRVRIVERNRAVLATARERFGLAAAERLEIELGDGRAALERPGAWTLIVVDAFGAGDFPSSLATVEAFRLARDRLAPGGAVAVNLAGRLNGPVLRGVLAGVVEAFGAERTVLFGVPTIGSDPAYDPARCGNSLAFGFRDGVPKEAPGSRVPAEARARLRYLDEIAALRRPAQPGSPHHDSSAPRSLPIG